ncbi:MAG: hypothetical protein WBD87_08785 [Candidatus Acidiferrales bacterium]
MLKESRRNLALLVKTEAETKLCANPLREPFLLNGQRSREPLWVSSRGSAALQTLACRKQEKHTEHLLIFGFRRTAATGLPAISGLITQVPKKIPRGCNLRCRVEIEATLGLWTIPDSLASFGNGFKGSLAQPEETVVPSELSFPWKGSS